MMAKTLESELFRRRFDDGVLDLIAGLAIFGIGMGWIFGQVIFAAILPTLLWPFWSVIHKSVVVPRLGDVEFSDTRKAKISAAHIGLLVLGAVSCAFGVLAFALVEGWIESIREVTVPLVLLVPSLVMAVAAIVGYLMIGALRMLVYALVFIASGAVFQLVLPYDPAHSLAVGGAVPMVAGAVMLIRFLRAHPVARGD